MRKGFLRKILFVCFCIIILIIYFWPDRQIEHSYDYIHKDNIIWNLHEELAVNFTSSAVSNCEYYDSFNDETSLSPSLVDGDLPENHKIRDGGEYAPLACRPRYSTAIIVPYRDQAEQLRGFLVYMHMFLRHQQIHYRIYVVEQVDSNPYNRAKLINIGAQAAIKAGYPCLVLHNVEMLPLRPANLYACTKMPRHMSTNINKFSLILPYMTLFGGVVALMSKQFRLINGMSNEFNGFGGEDDDFYLRLNASHLKVCRFDNFISKYHMMVEDNQKMNNQDWIKSRTRLNKANEKMSTDGLNSLRFTEVATVLHPLFTHIMVDL